MVAIDLNSKILPTWLWQIQFAVYQIDVTEALDTLNKKKKKESILCLIFVEDS